MHTDCESLGDIIISKGCEIVLHGWSHWYCRNRRMKTNKVSPFGLVYLTFHIAASLLIQSTASQQTYGRGSSRLNRTGRTQIPALDREMARHHGMMDIYFAWPWHYPHFHYKCSTTVCWIVTDLVISASVYRWHRLCRRLYTLMKIWLRE